MASILANVTELTYSRGVLLAPRVRLGQDGEHSGERNRVNMIAWGAARPMG
jgi:hypothetical protein